MPCIHIKRSCRPFEIAMVSLAFQLSSSPAWAVAGLESLVNKVNQFNTALIGFGGAISVTGFIWAVASLVLGFAGADKAVMCLIGGLVIATAPQIVGFFTGGS